MGKRGGPRHPESGSSAAPDRERQDAPFEIREHIGRQLRAMFNEVVDQPIPDKLSRLLEELAQKRPKD